MNNINYQINTSTLEDIKKHLYSCSNSFVPPLESYVDISKYSQKIFGFGIRFEAYNNNILIGLIALYVDKQEKTSFITNVSVDPNFQKNKIAENLLSSCVGYLKENCYLEVTLHVNKNNTKAINFYKKHNFKEKGSLKNNLLMELEIQRNYNQELKDTSDHKYAYNFDFDVMHHYMIESFKPFFKGNDVLELGSFKGDFTKRLIPYFEDITCVEASDEAIEIAKQNLGDNITYYNSLFENTVLPKKYNNIVLTHVLEHIDNPVGLLEKINNEWLTEDGNLFIVCPNANAPSRQIAVKMGLISHNSAITPSEAEHGHRITYTLDTLERDATKGNLKIIHRSGIFFKALANFQWDQLLNTDIISKEYLDGCFKLGQQYPDLCSSIMLVCKKS
jgi:ribosomal protein S18 acetylase RimI-like enzyme